MAWFLVTLFIILYVITTIDIQQDLFFEQYQIQKNNGIEFTPVKKWVMILLAIFWPFATIYFTVYGVGCLVKNIIRGYYNERKKSN